MLEVRLAVSRAIEVGAVHRHGSLAVVERWWKSMKVEYASRLHPCRLLRTIKAKLRGYVRWFRGHIRASDNGLPTRSTSGG